MTRAVKNASLNEKRRKRGVPLEIDVADESRDAEEKEMVYDMRERHTDEGRLDFCCVIRPELILWLDDPSRPHITYMALRKSAVSGGHIV